MTRMVSGLTSELLLSTYPWKWFGVEIYYIRIVHLWVGLQYFWVDACSCIYIYINLCFSFFFCGFLDKKLRRAWELIYVCVMVEEKGNLCI